MLSRIKGRRGLAKTFQTNTAGTAWSQDDRGKIESLYAW